MSKLFFFSVAILTFLAGCSQYSKVTERPLAAVAASAEQRALSKSLKRRSADPRAQLGVLMDAANRSRLRLMENSSSTLDRSDYNFAVARIVEIIDEQKLAPWESPVEFRSETSGEWSLTLSLPDQRLERRVSSFDVSPSDRYKFKGKLVGTRSIKQGLGAPVVMVGRDLDLTAYDKFAQGKQLYYGLTAVIHFNGKDCQLRLTDPLEHESVTFDDHIYPLSADFQAPLALALAELDFEKIELGGMFKPDEYLESARLARLQPFNAEKIPVLLVHGLGNSPATWAPLIDFLRGDAEIRKHFQFWFFSYPSGLPYSMSAAILREQLDQIRNQYPDHKDIVLVGHSMGAMISRLLITDSGMTIWNAIYDKPPSELPVREETRQLIESSLIFEARPDISRVIYASASHRGSEDATNFLGRLGAWAIGRPIAEEQIDEEAIANVRPEIRAKRKHIPNSVDVLDPDSAFLKVVDTLPPKKGIPYHSIIGDRGKGGNLDRTKPVSSDGIVPYWSSHIDGAESELIIPSGHWSILHPLGMVEIQRILLAHIRQR